MTKSALHRAIGLGLVALSAYACSPQGVRRTDTPDRVELRLAEARFEPVAVRARVTETDEDVVLAFPLDLVETPTGFAIVDTGNQRVVLLDDSLRYVDAFGREGDGPGEFRMPTEVEWSGEYLIVGDAGNGRLSYFTQDGSLSHSERIPGNMADMALHPRLGMLVVTDGLAGYYMARLTPEGPVPFGPVPERLRSPRRQGRTLPNDRVAVLPNGDVVVYDALEDVIVRFGESGRRSRVVEMPAEVATHMVEYRQGLVEAFGGPDAVLGVSVVSGLFALPDGRLLMLHSYEDAFAFVLDPARAEAIGLFYGGESAWLRGPSAALFDGTRLVTLPSQGGVAVVEMRLAGG